MIGGQDLVRRLNVMWYDIEVLIFNLHKLNQSFKLFMCSCRISNAIFGAGIRKDGKMCIVPLSDCGGSEITTRNGAGDSTRRLVVRQS